MKLENQMRIGMLLLIAAVAGPLALSPSIYPMSTRVAAIGGLVAFVGVLAIARPVWRVGVFQWISNNVYSGMDMDPRYFKSPEPEVEPKVAIKERADDEAFQNVFGPMLVGVGTLVSGFSGYFG